MPDWEAGFPNLGKWEKTSEPTDDYNCIAFAAGDQDQWWDPFPPNFYYWPARVPRSYALEAFIVLFRARGYEICDDGVLEEGFEKIVLYTNEHGGIAHAARQLTDGRWTSKMGAEEDIAHGGPGSLAGGDYGEPTCYMRRLVTSKNDDSTA